MPQSAIHVLPIGPLENGLLEDLRRDLNMLFRMPVQVSGRALDPAFAFHNERRQYHSTYLLGRLAEAREPGCWRRLAVTGLDLYMPILTFVFGEAQLTGDSAIVSLHRLRQEFYGLPADPLLLRQRLAKEAVHELGHTLGLTHCDDYGCVMAASHSVEWIDIKSAGFCPDCRNRVVL